MTEQPAPDWEEFIRRHQTLGMVELELSTLQPDDTLIVVTSHTAYSLRMLGHDEAMLTTNRPDRPSGKVRINGCTFGASSSIKPNHIFCGGSLEFTHNNGREISTTTEIRALQLVHNESTSSETRQTGGAPAA